LLDVGPSTVAEPVTNDAASVPSMSGWLPDNGTPPAAVAAVRYVRGRIGDKAAGTGWVGGVGRREDLEREDDEELSGVTRWVSRNATDREDARDRCPTAVVRSSSCSPSSSTVEPSPTCRNRVR